MPDVAIPDDSLPPPDEQLRRRAIPADAPPMDPALMASAGRAIPVAGGVEQMEQNIPRRAIPMPVAAPAPAPGSTEALEAGEGALHANPRSAPIQTGVASLWTKAQNIHNPVLRVLGEIGAGGARALDTIGSIAAPRIAAAIPGSTVNTNLKAAKAQQQEKEQAGVGLTNAQTANLESEIKARENPKPDKAETPQQVLAGIVAEDIDKGVKPADDPRVGQVSDTITGLQREPAGKPMIHETDQGIFMVNPETREATPLTYQGKPLMPKTGPEANKLAGEIEAQVGPKPTAAEYAGRVYPSVAAAQTAWGKAAEAVKNREAAAGAAARGESFGSFRPVQVIDPATGQVRYEFAKTAIGEGAAPAGAGMQAMAKGQQMQEMHVAAGKAREAITNLDKPFTAEQIGKLTLAMRQDDPGVFRTEIETMLGTQQLTPHQEDFVVWIAQLNERAMSLRNVAGMGQGSEDMRKAIRATLPSVKSGSKELAIKQLDAFENQVSILEHGIPGVKNETLAAKPAAKPAGNAPAVGAIEQGYKFKGGNPADQANWEKVAK